MAEEMFGRYQLVELIGHGGMGAVFKAHDTTLHRDVAIKILPPEFASDDGYRERFQREAFTAARLNEPHIIPIFDYGEIDGRLFLVMPVVTGTDVATVLEREGAMTPQRAVRVIEQLAAALNVAHEAGLVHRDIKPSNALLTGQDFVYLIDFGIAHDASAPKLTRTGSIVGTWAYMAPERFTAGTADARADVYALACALHECLTGQLPYPGDSAQQYHGHVALDPPRPTAVDPAIPAGFDEVIARGMAKDPQQRYHSALMLAAAAREALTAPASPLAPQPPPIPPGPTQSQPSAPSVGAAATLVAPDAPPTTASPQAALTDRDIPAPAEIDAEQREAPSRPARRRVLTLTAAAVVVAAIVLATFIVINRHSGSGAQTVVPFTGLSEPEGVAVNDAGTVYAADYYNSRVVTVSAGSTAQTALPFTGLKYPDGVAVDRTGAVYVADWSHNRVVKLAAGSSQQTVLPFTGLDAPEGVAVDGTGAVYVLDTGGRRVVKLGAGATQQTVLPFTDLNRPVGVAADSGGAIYVADTYNNRVVKLAAGASQQTVLPFTDLNRPAGVAADTGGAIYVADTHNNRVVKLAAGATQQTVLPFTDLNRPYGVAVDGIGAVYVTDSKNNRVVKLQQH